MTMKYPFVEDTLGKKLQAGSGLSVDCMTCHRNVKLDVQALVDGWAKITAACTGI